MKDLEKRLTDAGVHQATIKRVKHAVAEIERERVKRGLKAIDKEFERLEKP